MVLNYRGAPPFRKPVQTITSVLGREYARSVASEEMLRNVAQDYRIIEPSNYDVVKELMDTTGLKEGVDWWLVKWADEGLPDPSTGSDYVIKIKVPAGGSKNVAMLMMLGDYPYIISFLWYGSDSIKIRASRQNTPAITLNNAEFPVYEYYGTSTWTPDVFMVWFLEHRRSFIVWEISNDGTNDEYVYIAIIIVKKIEWVSERIAVAGGRKKLNNETWTIAVWIPVKGKAIPIRIGVGIAGDGTNAMTANIYIEDLVSGSFIQIASYSNTSTTLTWYHTQVTIKQKQRDDVDTFGIIQIRIEFSTVGTGDARLALQLYKITEDVSEEYKRVSGSYTSDGNGIADTVTILDYSTSKYHIGRILRVYAVGDANTTELQLQVDGNVIWDFLNDGNTCTLDIRDIKKVELIVNDNGSATTTSTTTVKYVIQYTEEKSMLVS